MGHVAAPWDMLQGLHGTCCEGLWDMFRGLHRMCCEGSTGHVARAPWDIL